MMNNLTQWFDNSPIPLGLKWSLIIACFVTLVMGALGWFLINLEEGAHRDKNEVLGQVVVEQLARAASEPLLADDNLTLNVLISQQEKNDLIIGMQIYDLDGNLHASAGVSPTNDALAKVQRETGVKPLLWSTPDVHALSFVSPISYQDVTAGLAIVSIDRRPLETRLKTLTNALATTTVGLIFIGVILVFPLAHRMCQPIYHLVEVGEALDSGDTQKLIAANRKDEIGQVLGAFQKMAVGLEKKREVEDAFSRFVSPTIANEVLNKPEGSELGGSISEGSVLFCDIVGYTQISENLTPEEVGLLINRYFRYFSIAAHSCQGTVDKFIGDCIMILFGVPQSDENHGLHAVTCAVLIQEIAARINHQRSAGGLSTVEFRIGVNSGSMLAGNLGSEERMQYTVVGDTVNLASRLGSISKPRQILITEQTLRQPGVASLVRSRPQATVRVKGRRQPVTPYLVDSGDFIQDAEIRESLEQILPMSATI